jgi:U3 small nucleolar RNA-associated protein 22
LLPSVRPKYDGSAAANLEFVLRKLHEFLYSIPPVQPLHPLEASVQLQKQAIAVPYCQPLPTEDTNWKVSFEQPADIKLVGSWVNKLSIKSKDGEKFCVDIGVEMPNVSPYASLRFPPPTKQTRTTQTLFQEKDYLNGRFFHKRAFYIASIAAALKENFPVHLSFQSTFNDPRLTTLVLRSREGELTIVSDSFVNNLLFTR